MSFRNYSNTDPLWGETRKDNGLSVSLGDGGKVSLGHWGMIFRLSKLKGSMHGTDRV
jgi:hypothetical protein